MNNYTRENSKSPEETVTSALLEKRVQLEVLITRREGMMAENQQRAYLEQAVAFDEGAFLDLANDMTSLISGILVPCTQCGGSGVDVTYPPPNYTAEKRFCLICNGLTVVKKEITK